MSKQSVSPGTFRGTLRSICTTGMCSTPGASWYTYKRGNIHLKTWLMLNKSKHIYSMSCNYHVYESDFKQTGLNLTCSLCGELQTWDDWVSTPSERMGRPWCRTGCWLAPAFLLLSSVGGKNRCNQSINEDTACLSSSIRGGPHRLEDDYLYV